MRIQFQRKNVVFIHLLLFNGLKFCHAQQKFLEKIVFIFSCFGPLRLGLSKKNVLPVPVAEVLLDPNTPG
jgi:hypothetical protein